MKTCTICKGSIAYPEITGKTHFVCDGRVPARKPFAVGQQCKQRSAGGADVADLLVQLQAVVDAVGVDELLLVQVVDLVILTHDVLLI